MKIVSKWRGSEKDESGVATCLYRGIEYEIKFEKFSDYHRIHLMLNDAFRDGQEAAANRLKEIICTEAAKY